MVLFPANYSDRTGSRICQFRARTGSGGNFQRHLAWSIGCLFGSSGAIGIQMNIGTKAYLDSVNAQGGVHARKVELKIRDDRYEANLCLENTKKFIEED